MRLIALPRARGLGELCRARTRANRRKRPTRSMHKGTDFGEQVTVLGLWLQRDCPDYFALLVGVDGSVRRQRRGDVLMAEILI